MRLVHEPADGGDAERTETRGDVERGDTRGNVERGDTRSDVERADTRSDVERADTGGDSRELASTVETADSLLAQARGLMFRRSVPDDYALAFRFATAKTRDVHMVFVFVPLDVVWVADDVVQRVERLRPWRGYARETADLIVELPAGGADGVEPGDRVVLLE